VDECKPLPLASAALTASVAAAPASPPVNQGLTLVHFLAQRKRFLWNRGCLSGLIMGCAGGMRGYYAVFRVYFVSETAQVALKSGRV
jgi:hypothetical protein